MHDARENVGAPTSHCRKRRAPDWYTGYMALMRKGVEGLENDVRALIEYCRFVKMERMCSVFLKKFLG